MSTTEEIKISTITANDPIAGLSDQTAQTESRLVEKNIDRDHGHLSEIDAFHHDNLSKSANDSYFKSLLAGIQTRIGPDHPRSHTAVDLIVTILCFTSVHYFYLGNLELSAQRSVVLLSALALMPLSMYMGGMYSPKLLKSLNKELTILILCWMFSFAAIGLFAFLTKTAADVSRVWITLSMTLSLSAMVAIRVLVSLGFITGNEAKTKNIVLWGDNSGVKSVIDNLSGVQAAQIRIARVFAIGEHLNTFMRKTSSVSNTDVLKSSAIQLSEFIEKQRKSGTAVEQVWIAVSENQAQIVKQVSDVLTDSSVDVCIVPDNYAQRLRNGEATRYGNFNIVNVSEVALPLSADPFKRLCDVVIASVTLLFLGLPMLMIAGLIKLESTGPALFRQKRYGVDGREIEILKFRSMFVHSDSEAKQATKNDARVTRVGKIIRSTSLDELPQLLNVLNGSMSLIGPRPHAIAHNEMWRTEIHGYMLRHKVKPGITGWAQVNGWRGETDTAYKMQQRVNHDLEYIKNWSPWLDIKILFLTIFVGFFHKNAY